MKSDNMMDFRLLRTFVAIVENRSFVQAAEALGVAQPTVSAQISALEEDLGALLFDRERRPVQLTASGEAFLIHARAILNEIEAARGSVSDFLRARRGTVRLGTYPSATAGFVPTLLHEFGRDHPLMNIHLVELGGSFMEHAAVSGEVNLFLRQTTPPLSSTMFNSHPLWREDFKVLMPADHELAREEGPVQPERLLQYKLIMTGRYQTEGILTHPLWHSLGEPPNVVYEVSQPQSLIELVRSNIGIGVTTALAVSVSRIDGLAMRPIAHDAAVRDVRIYWLRGKALPAASRVLLDFMIKKSTLPACVTSLR